MIENPLEFAGGFGWLTCGKVRQAANIDGIEVGPEGAAAGDASFEGRGDREYIESFWCS